MGRGEGENLKKKTCVKKTCKMYLVNVGFDVFDGRILQTCFFHVEIYIYIYIYITWWYPYMAPI